MFVCRCSLCGIKVKQSDVCSFFCVFTFEREKTVLEAHVARKKKLLLQKKSGFFAPGRLVISKYAWCEMVLLDTVMAKP